MVMLFRFAVAPLLVAALLVAPALAETPAPDDAAIERSIASALAALGELRDVRVDSVAGVVTLEGTADSPQALNEAGAIASRAGGVLTVRNEIELATEFSRLMAPALRRSRAFVSEFIAFLPLLGVALVIVVVFTLAARVLSGWDGLWDRVVRNALLRGYARTGAGLFVAVIGVLLALELLDATALVGAVLGTAGVAGLALGFAFKDTVENYIAGVLLSLRQPFRPNDHILVDGIEGRVLRLTSRAVVLITFDGNHARIPNARVFQGTLLNFSRHPHRRFDFQVGVGTDVDAGAAQALAVETLVALEGVLGEPAPFAVVEALGDSNVVIGVYGWVDQEQASFGKVRSEAIRQVKAAFEAAHYDMPEPIYRVRVERQAAKSGKPAPPPAPAAPAAPALDIAPDDEIRVQVERERRAGEDDLLSERAELE